MLNLFWFGCVVHHVIFNQVALQMSFLPELVNLILLIITFLDVHIKSFDRQTKERQIRKDYFAFWLDNKRIVG